MSVNLPAKNPDLLDPITYTHRKIDLPKAIKLRNQGLSYEEIGTFFDCTKQAVYYALKPFIPENNGAQAMKDHSLDLLRGKGYWLHKYLTPDEIKDLSPRDKLTGIGIIHDKILQEERKDVPQAVNINVLGADIDKLNVQINQLEQSIGLNTSDDMLNSEDDS